MTLPPPTTVDAPTTYSWARTAAPAGRQLLDPTAETEPAARDRLARPASLEGRRIGLLDISKPRGDVFLDQLDRQLTRRGWAVARYAKPTFTKPAPIDLRQEISVQCDVVIEALAD